MEGKELFISYGRGPVVTKFVHKLKTDLEAVGFSVWLDANDIPAGSDWHGAIGAGLSRCKAIIPVITNKYLGSRYCTKELYTADSDKKLIFPIMFEEVDFESSESGQGVKFTTSSVNWTMCRPGVDDYDASMTKLISAMRAKGLGGGEDADIETTKAPLPATTVFKPLVGPVTTVPFKVIPDVENPEGITTTPDGGLVVSIMRQKVLIFNSSHEKILELGGVPGLGMGQFLSPTGVAIDSDGNILVASHYFVKRFSGTGKCLQQAGGTGQDGSLSIDSPRGLAIGREGRIYITEQQKHRVTVLNSDLTLYKRFSQSDRMLGSGHLNLPQGIAVNSKGNVYVADMMNHVVQVFDAEGTFLFRFGGMGHGPGTMTSPTAVAIDAEDYVYVGTASGTVSIFSDEGKFLRAFGEQGMEVGKFSMIRALHLDRCGVLYVGEWTANRIQMFKTQEPDQESVDSDAKAAEKADQTQNLAQDTPLSGVQTPLETAALNITGEGSGMTVIGGGGGVVNIGPGVVLGGHVAIQPGAKVIAQHGTSSVPIPVPVPSDDVMSWCFQQLGVGGVEFANPASAPCRQAGVREPVRVLETDGSVYSMAVSEAGDMVVCGDETLTLYNSHHQQVCQEPGFSYTCVAFEDQHAIVAVSTINVMRLDKDLKVVSKVKISDIPGLVDSMCPYALALGNEGSLYITGSEKGHIIKSDFSHGKTFAEGCGQAFAIAVSKSGNVYLPITSESTVCVFSPDGNPLFRFGGPDRAPLPFMSLQSPISIAIDCHDDVYVGLGLQNIMMFDSEGKYKEEFAASSNFESMPKPMCTDPNRERLFVAIDSDSKVLVYNLTS